MKLKTVFQSMLFEFVNMCVFRMLAGGLYKRPGCNCFLLLRVPRHSLVGLCAGSQWDPGVTHTPMANHNYFTFWFIGC